MRDFLVDLGVGVVLFLVNHIAGFKARLIKQLRLLRIALSEEKKETKLMIQVYGRFVSGKSSRYELQLANRQLRELMKTMGLGVLIVLPFSFLTLPILVRLGDRLGLPILPKAWRQQEMENQGEATRQP
ncbi:hypothetical protein [Pseudobacteriovorax antillogorgiicola]|uniref:LETM1-like protein n=1 Tax=Pseudobacteriovorax antillogorgiicola TaxID=1513793 RepID=A0A1Y6CT17_9BACT|nr:hypothetical protein [Pseudobacteriovorax antillogorgiicola]TCS44820.1 hypothetical protein EDD56_13149 [Pseudobacteriovorax antillogorgiicola]SMF77236.1 hypothetical protein SAMN06296036_13115 [Pseudobacteriovorax antillogorgiicola]